MSEETEIKIQKILAFIGTIGLIGGIISGIVFLMVQLF